MIRIQIPAAEFISANDRPHWATKARRTATIRQRAMLAARASHVDPAPIPCLVTVTITRPKGGRLRDAENAAPTCKAAIDGLRDARVLAEDDRSHVVAVITRIAPKNGAGAHYVLDIDFIPQEVKRYGA